MSESNHPLPLVTFILFAYNQEQFIREAVAGALSQTYSPLEIILSDDASTDQTFCIMQELAVAYKGPHRVILNCTGRNQGCAHHVNSVIPLSSGSWIVTAAGDDISFPERVSGLMQAAREDARVTALCSAWRNMDESGCECEPDVDYQGRNGPARIRECRLDAPRFAFHGAAAAWRRELYTSFSPLRPDVMHEDLVLTFRALLCGDIIALPDVLVSYRRWGGNVSAGANLNDKTLREQVRARELHFERWNRLLAVAYRQMMIDLETPNFFRRALCEADESLLKDDLSRLIRVHTLKGNWWQASVFLRLRSCCCGFPKAWTASTVVWAVPRFCGLAFFSSVYAIVWSQWKRRRIR